MEPIAIIGFAFKLPGGAEDESSLWEMLQEARNVMSDYPPSRVNIEAFYSPERKRNNTLYSKGAHFIDGDPAAFDAPFFSITRSDAMAMDPQHRKLLEVSYHCFENAGITMENAAGSDTAVYVSTMATDYEKLQSKDPDTNSASGIAAMASSVMAGRVSGFFDLHGPCLHIDTACSSSLIALDVACQSLRNKGSKAALVAAANLILSPEASITESNMLFLSPDSVSASFTSRGNGYGRGEGVVAMLLKPLSDAIADGDMIRAVIRGTGSNHDGHTLGVGRPNSNAQEALIRRVYRNAGLEMGETRFFEAHGTGTAVGDPIETKAIGRVFRNSRSSSEPLFIGSIKANIGHIEAGSGIAGVIKAILVLEKGVIPPNALFDTINPEIDAEFYNLKVPTSCTSWPSTGLRRISVNSFGFGGSNAHVILDDAHHYLEAEGLVGHHCTSKFPSNMSNGYHSADAPLQNGYHPADAPLQNGYHPADAPLQNGYHVDDSQLPVGNSQILVLSAKDQQALKRSINAHGTYYSTHIYGEPDKLRRLSYTLANKRSVFAWRSFAIVSPSADIDAKLLYNGSTDESNNDSHAFDIDKVQSLANRADTTKLGIGFIFTGQGAQYPGMGLDLLRYPIFRSTISAVGEIFRDLGASWDIVDEIREGLNIHSPEYSQPLCTGLQIALVELLRSWGVMPYTVVGHSSGEIAAAYATGALDMKSACKVAYWRGKLAGSLAKSTLQPGAMLSVNLSRDAMAQYLSTCGLDATLTVACENSPSNVTISGPRADIGELQGQLASSGIQALQVNTGVAYHSPAMNEIAEQYLEKLGDLQAGSSAGLGKKPVTVLSTVIGRVVSPSVMTTAQYWIDNLLSPVKFLDAMEQLTSSQSNVGYKLGQQRLQPIYDLIEIGPHSALRRPVRDILSEKSQAKRPRYWGILNRLQPGSQTTLELAGRLFTHGYAVNIEAANSPTAEARPPAMLVNTPPYPFDDSQHYWEESRLSRDFRLRGGGTGSGVLGVRANDWNPLVPRWRKFVSIEEMPWVADHEVTGTPLFPAAGMMVMAIAAAEFNAEANGSKGQLNSEISGYHIKEASFLFPIVVRSRVELVTELRPLRKTYEKVSTSCEVRIFTYTESEEDEKGRWTACFHAKVQTQYKPSTSGIDAGLESQLAAEKIRDEFNTTKRSCNKPMSKQSFYAYHATNGLKYGPTFQLLDDIRWDDEGNSTATLRSSSLDQQIGAITHPATLDAGFQACITACWSKSMDQPTSTLVPHRLWDGFVSASGWQKATTSGIQVMTSSRFRINSKGIASRVAILGNDGELLCDMKKIEISPIGGDTGVNSSTDRKWLYGIGWKPQVSMMTGDQILSACQTTRTLSEEEEQQNRESAMLQFSEDLESMIRVVLKSTLHELSTLDVKQLPEHFQYYMAWMQSQCEPYQASETWNGFSEKLPAMDEVWDNLLAQRPSWRLYVTIARNLPAILRGEVDPLHLLYSEEEAEDFYADLCASTLPKLNNFFTLSAHENPNQRILEVGAGTGSMTSNILSAFKNHEQATGATAFAQYMYTDVSSAFFEAAKAGLADFASDGRVAFQTLDLDKDIATQGFEPHQYDMIIAGSVLHATQSLKLTLLNLRRALKPGGKLVFLEITGLDRTALTFAFGTLSGWWNSDVSKNTLNPAVDEKSWDLLLRETGFSGNDVIVRDWQDPRCQYYSLIVSTAEPEKIINGVLEEEIIPQTNIVFVTAGTENQLAIAEGLMQQINTQNIYTWSTIPLKDIEDDSVSDTDTVVFLLEMELPVLEHVEGLSFEQLKKALLHGRKILWVSATDPADPSYSSKSLSTGLLRSLRSEDARKQIISLTIEDANWNSSPSTTSTIAKVFTASFESDSTEIEYCVRKNQMYTPRLVHLETINNDISAALSPALRQEAWPPKKAVTLSIGAPGNLETLQFVEDPENSTELGPYDVEVEARAWGLSFRDIFVALGRLEEDDFGFECAGVVTRVGSQCTGLFPEDRVVLLTRGCMRQYARCNVKEVQRIPPNMSFEEAASALSPAATAVHSLIDVARLRRGEKVLIHSAAGGTGQLAIMLAKDIGAEIYCTVGSEKKKQFLMDQFGIPGSHILYSRDTSFARGIRRLTNGYGVDVLLNTLSGEGLLAGWECMAPYGRFIEIGKADIIANEGLPMSGFQRNVTFSAVDFYHITQFRTDMVEAILTKVMVLLNQGKISGPRPVHVYPVSKMEQAFRYLQSGQHTGRIIIKPNHGDVIPTYLSRKPTWRFDTNASYLIVGGFGGLGRAIMTWMAMKGAKYFIVPSRSGPVSPAAAGAVAQLRESGVQIFAPKCDASSKPELEAALQEAREQMPPIKGCINSAMVLQDMVLANMSDAQWRTTIHSKVKSSVNLDSLLPTDLDFFILLSSLAGIYGTPAQANYAAGCTSQDALARQRVMKGLKAVSWDIGYMRTIGAVAESERYQQVRDRDTEMEQIEENEFLALLDIYCDPEREYRTLEDSQVLLAPVIPANIREAGNEPPDILNRPLFSGFNIPRGTGQQSMTTEANQLKPSVLFEQAKTSDDRAFVVVQELVNKLGRALSVSPSEIDTAKPPFEYGVDSLVALELRNWLLKEFSAEIAVFDIMGGTSIAGIGKLTVQKSSVGLP